MENIDKNYKLKGLYFEISRNPQGVRETLKPVEISVSPEEVLCIRQLKAEDQGTDDCPDLVGLRQDFPAPWDVKKSLISTTRANAMIQSVIKNNMVFLFVPIKVGGMTPENWEQVRKRQLVKIENPQNNIISPVIWINPIPELLNTPRFVCCGNATIYYPNRCDRNSSNPEEEEEDYPPVETNLVFPREVKVISTTWINRGMADTAYSALRNPVCDESAQYSLYFKGCRQSVSIPMKDEFYESAMKEIFQGRHTRNENYVRLPGYYGELHLSNIWKIRWKKIHGLFYINIKLRSNGFKHMYWWESLQFCKKMKKTEDTIERWMETSGIKPRFFRKINEYTYVNRHGGKDDKTESTT